MPEGPEIRRAADRVAAAIEGRVADNVFFAFDELKAAGVPRAGYRFWVYGRAGAPCRVCGRRVAMDTVGGRKCFWCPSCQPESAGPGNGR